MSITKKLPNSGEILLIQFQCCCWGHITVRGGVNQSFSSAGADGVAFSSITVPFLMAVWEKSWIWFSTCFTCSFAMLWMCRRTFKGMFVLGTIKLIHFFLCMLQGSHYLSAEGRSFLTCPCQKGGSRAIFLSPSASRCPGQGISHSLKSHKRQDSLNLFTLLYPCQVFVPAIHNSCVQCRRTFFPWEWRPAYSCSPVAPQRTFAQAQADACIPSSMPCECLPPDWLLKLLGYSWACLSGLSSHHFSSASHRLPITAQLNESYSKWLMHRLQMAGMHWKTATFLSPKHVSCQDAGNTSSC